MDYNISSEKLEHPLLKGLLDELIPVFQKLEIKFFVIGATARDIIMELHGEKSGRRTQDIDIAIAVDKWEEFSTIEKEIIQLSNFQKDKKQKQRFLYLNDFQLDIVPYGGITTNEDKIFWPPDQSFAMSVLGFEEAEKEVLARIEKLMSIKGTQTVESFHKRLGKIIWDKCGMARNAEGLKQAIAEVQALKKEFWSDVRIPGEINEMNPELDKANRVADFIELGELMCIDALNRNESCGGHFREEYQTEDGEALRDDENFMYVASWEFKGEHNWELHKEELKYEVIKPSQRNYK